MEDHLKLQGRTSWSGFEPGTLHDPDSNPEPQSCI